MLTHFFEEHSIDLNASYLKVNPKYEPPFTPGTKVYKIINKDELRFVRVFSNEDQMISRWIIKPDDIVGLTAKEIQDKFSIPGKYPPTHICDIIVPKGTALEISSANGIFGHNGGGIQYRFFSKYGEERFDNGRVLP